MLSIPPTSRSFSSSEEVQRHLLTDHVGGNTTSKEQSRPEAVTCHVDPLSIKQDDFDADVKVVIELEDDASKGSFLWRIESNPPSYFFGTIHVPYIRVWDAIPNNVKNAFAASKRVYFELDLTKQHTISSLSACQKLPRNRVLSQEIPSELYAKIR